MPYHIIVGLERLSCLGTCQVVVTMMEGSGTLVMTWPHWCWGTVDTGEYTCEIWQLFSSLDFGTNEMCPVDGVVKLGTSIVATYSGQLPAANDHLERS